jgi:RND family efflux transporter MFP subunit
MESHDTIPKDLPKIRPIKLMIILGLICAIFVGGFIVRYSATRKHQDELNQQAQAIEDQPPIVDVVYPKVASPTVELTLPGNATAYQQTDLYARINGYLDQWDRKDDIGAIVKKGHVLAKIAAPEVDAQLAQAQAALDQAKANVLTAQTNYDLANATAKRYEGLIPTGGVTQQQLDEKQSAASQALSAKTAAEAAVKSADANIRQLTAQTGFEQIVAPFDGIITARTYDIGALISPSNTGPGQELFEIAETDILRIFVSVPQSYATMIKPGEKADFFVTNYAGRAFPGTVARSTGSINTTTRTLLTEVDVDNPDNALFPGMYGQIHFSIPRPEQVLTVPTSAMMFESTGTLLGVVDADSIVHFRKVSLGRDLGTELEIRTGLTAGELVVANPGEKLADGIKVQIATLPKKPVVADSAKSPGSAMPAGRPATTMPATAMGATTTTPASAGAAGLATTAPGEHTDRVADDLTGAPVGPNSGK